MHCWHRVVSRATIPATPLFLFGTVCNSDVTGERAIEQKCSRSAEFPLRRQLGYTVGLYVRKRQLHLDDKLIVDHARYVIVGSALKT